MLKMFIACYIMFWLIGVEFPIVLILKDVMKHLSLLIYDCCTLKTFLKK